jgi:hypothetical protein
MCFPKAPSITQVAPSAPPPPPTAPLAIEEAIPSAVAAREALTARRRLRNDLAIPAGVGVGLTIPK